MPDIPANGEALVPEIEVNGLDAQGNRVLVLLIPGGRFAPVLIE